MAGEFADSIYVEEFFRSQYWNIWEALLVAYGLIYLRPGLAQAAWFPLDHLLSQMNVVDLKNELTSAWPRALPVVGFLTRPVVASPFGRDSEACTTVTTERRKTACRNDFCS